VPANVTDPVVPVLGVRPVVPALNEVTALLAMFAVDNKVPLVGNVTDVAAVLVKVIPNAPLVVKVLPLAKVNVPVVEVIVRPFIEVAVAAPREGVVSVGDVANTTLPEPVVEAADIAVPLPCKIPVMVVDKVNEGVVPPDEVPAKPFAVATEIVVIADPPAVTLIQDVPLWYSNRVVVEL
jgi:hypothetical protein